MSTARWGRSDLGLIVGKQGVCAVCPTCGLPVPIVDLAGVDSCACGTLVRVSVETRGPGKRERLPGTNHVESDLLI